MIYWKEIIEKCAGGMGVRVAILKWHEREKIYIQNENVLKIYMLDISMLKKIMYIQIRDNRFFYFDK